MKLIPSKEMGDEKIRIGINFYNITIFFVSVIGGGKRILLQTASS